MDDPFSGIEAFVVAAEETSFRGAATRLGVTPAAISKAIGRLEDDLGVRLLDRTTRTMKVTPEGAIYLEHSRKALEEVRIGRTRIEQSKEVAEGELVVALSSVLGPALVRRLDKFLALYPGLSLRLQFEDRESRLVDEQIDVALRIGKLEDSAQIAFKLLQLRWVTVAAPTYLAKCGVPAEVSALKDHECLAYRSSKGVEVAWTFLKHPDSEEVESYDFSKRLVMDDGRSLVDAALHGIGVAHVFGYMVEELINEGRLVRLLSEYSAPGPTLHAVCKPGLKDLPKVRAFLDFVRAEFQ